jgi:hypothetical protein
MTAAGGELLALRPTAEPLEVTRLE